MSLDKGKMPRFDAAMYTFGVAVSRFNGDLTDALLDDVLATLTCAGVPTESIKIVRVPGSGELPHACNLLAASGEFDAVVALGVVIAGDTPHHEILGNTTAAALQDIAISLQVPVINGIVVANNRQQAEARASGVIRRGVEFGEAALEMAYFTDSFLSEYETDGE